MVEEAEVLAAAGPRLEAGIEELAETEGAVVEGVAAGGAVVAVEIPLAVADADPVRHQCRQAFPEQPGQLEDLLREGQGCVDFAAVVPLDQVSGDLLQFPQGAGVGVASCPAGKQFQLPHPQEGRRNPGRDRRRVVDHDVRLKGAGLRRVPGPPDAFSAGHVKAEGARGGHPQGVHELLGEELAHA